MILGLIGIGILGGLGSAAATLLLGHGWLAALAAYSLGGTASLLLGGLSACLLQQLRRLRRPASPPEHLPSRQPAGQAPGPDEEAPGRPQPSTLRASGLSAILCGRARERPDRAPAAS